MMTSISLKGQSVSSSLKSSINDDMRKEMLKNMNPSIVSPNTQMRQNAITSKTVVNDDLLEFSKKYRRGSGGEEYEDKYSVKGLKESIKKTSTPINKASDGYVVPELINGHWVFTSPVKRADGLIIPSGISLGGGGKKEMSAKSKAILDQVFGIKVED